MVVGKKQNHRDDDLALTILLETARRGNICLNYFKLQYKKTEEDCFGKTYMTSGWKPAQTKVSAITSMPEPSCKKQVHSFIGMVNYLSKFSARLSELAEPVRELAKDKVVFNWGPEHQEAFNLIRKGDCRCPDIGLLQPQKTNDPSDRCKQQGAGCMPTTRGKTGILCK